MPLSAFLPPGFDPQRPVALIAGQGIYPVLVAQAIRAAGIPLRLVAFDEETRPELIASFPESDRRTLLVGQLEMSNVDLASELTSLITTQRAYEANSKVITTSDEILQSLVNLKR